VEVGLRRRRRLHRANPQHSYAKPGNYVVILDVSGPDGTARRSKVWDVQLK
jgi:hypothetical protein